MSLDDALKKRNPYLLKAKGIELAQYLVKTFIYDYITQRERTLFGRFLEELGLFIGNELYNGHTSSRQKKRIAGKQIRYAHSGGARLLLQSIRQKV